MYKSSIHPSFNNTPGASAWWLPGAADWLGLSDSTTG